MIILAATLLELKFSGDEKFGFLIVRVTEETGCLSLLRLPFLDRDGLLDEKVAVLEKDCAYITAQLALGLSP